MTITGGSSGQNISVSTTGGVQWGSPTTGGVRWGPTQGFTTAEWKVTGGGACDICGASIEDVAKHERWHDSIEWLAQQKALAKLKEMIAEVQRAPRLDIFKVTES